MPGAMTTPMQLTIDPMHLSERIHSKGWQASISSRAKWTRANAMHDRTLSQQTADIERERRGVASRFDKDKKQLSKSLKDIRQRTEDIRKRNDHATITSTMSKGGLFLGSRRQGAPRYLPQIDSMQECLPLIDTQAMPIGENPKGAGKRTDSIKENQHPEEQGSFLPEIKLVCSHHHELNEDELVGKTAPPLLLPAIFKTNVPEDVLNAADDNFPNGQMSSALSQKEIEEELQMEERNMEVIRTRMGNFMGHLPYAEEKHPKRARMTSDAASQDENDHNYNDLVKNYTAGRRLSLYVHDDKESWCGLGSKERRNSRDRRRSSLSSLSGFMFSPSPRQHQ